MRPQNNPSKQKSDFTYFTKICIMGLMKNCCIFDLDGTLTDTVKTLAHFVNETLSHYGFKHIETERFKELAGDGARNLIKRSLGCCVPSWTQEFEDKVLREYNEAYDNDPFRLCAPYDGIPELLAELKAKNCSLAVMTNKPQSTATKTVEHFFGKGTFDVIFGQRENVPIKPNPQGVFGIMSSLGVKPEQCLYVGDTSTDMKTGKNAGLFTVGVLWGFRGRAELEATGADVIIEKPAELVKFL